ncbi:glucose dehydrogenase [FAD, quinone]-like isoform X2 [Polistes fuscatus]|uniref:glucose dehydrogenase [FAD, quinone]-like isoform X2 n=1 Tax=Polistes fuscatus TaxID=30207 RepID=UPI001CA8E56A|nr:glucose dehydrogenase [FAD, quinone]-like isoform X2 [Polistes fuscatus]
MKKYFGNTLVILLVAIFAPVLTKKSNILSSVLWDLLRTDHFYESRHILSQYDFIIIGAGSAGSVVANRLTENPKWKVLVLESGEEKTVVSDVPAAAPATLLTDSAYHYVDSPSREMNESNGHCLSHKNKRCPLDVGNAIGGSSTINFMIYARGTPDDFNDWAALGNPGWAYDEILPYFIKSENCKVPDADKRFHGYNGYLDIEYDSYVAPIREIFFNATEELGYKLIDYNSKENIIGFSTAQATLDNGHRMDAARAFLKPIKHRKNLYLYKSCKVTKIVIDESTKTAIGVTFIKNGKKYFVRASKEVILSAGAINSPRLLMLSGIGPKDHLKSFDIKPIEDLPVGFNLQDHVVMTVFNFILEKPVIDTIKISTVLEYIFKGTGPLTLPGSVACLGFISTENDNESNINVKRDAELILSLGGFVGMGSELFQKIIGLSDEFYENVYAKYLGSNSFSIFPVLMHPKSRGRVSLKSADPLDDPIIDTNYFDHEDDVKTFVKAIKKMIELTSTESFRRFNITMVPLKFPGCDHTEYLTDSFWSCLVRHTAGTIWHYAGTCKMSPRDKSGVVDHRLKVHGIKSLRVVDNSVMPTIISGHLVSVAYMIAEKASDMIKEDWKFP